MNINILTVGRYGYYAARYSMEHYTTISYLYTIYDVTKILYDCRDYMPKFITGYFSKEKSDPIIIELFDIPKNEIGEDFTVIDAYF